MEVNHALPERSTGDGLFGPDACPEREEMARPSPAARTRERSAEEKGTGSAPRASFSFRERSALRRPEEPRRARLAKPQKLGSVSRLGRLPRALPRGLLALLRSRRAPRLEQPHRLGERELLDLGLLRQRGVGRPVGAVRPVLAIADHDRRAALGIDAELAQRRHRGRAAAPSLALRLRVDRARLLERDREELLLVLQVAVVGLLGAGNRLRE